MPDPIAPLAGLPSIPKLEGIGKWRRVRRLPPLRKIVQKPEVPGEKAEPLEASAMQGVAGTLPERIIWKWLKDRLLLFRVQVAEFGGRGELGGMALDFMVWGLAALPVVLRVQGEYWHGPHSDRKSLDDEQAGRLRLAGYLVVDLWEPDIYTAVRAGRLTDYIFERVI